MQNLLKRRLAPLFGIIAIVAVMGFIMIGCGEIEPEEALDEFPNPTVEAWEYGNYTGKPLTAVYKGKTAVTFSWYSVPETLIPNATDETYTPTAAGTYFVRATDKNKKFKNSLNVIVEQAPPQINFYGKWKTTQPFSSTDFPSGTTADEIIVIKDGKFRLDSTWGGRTGQAGDVYTGPNGTPLNPDNNNYSYKNEYLDLDISGWTALASKVLGGTTYEEAYSLNVTTATSSTKGYTIYSSFNLYLQTTTSGAATVVTMRRTGQAGADTVSRGYVLQVE